jgi:guanylate kinase
MNKYKVIAICGKSASGKDTLLQAMKRNNTDLHEIVSCTTRPPRDYEVDGINYFFLTLEEFAHKDCMGEMLEVSKFREWFYGTSLDGVKETAINIGVFNPTGIYSLMQLDFVDLFVVQVQASDKVRLMRSLCREVNPDVDEIVRRYWADKEDFETFSRFYEPDYIFDSEASGASDLEFVSQDIVAVAKHHWAKEAN